MPLLVLISPEENLKAELESCLGGLAQAPTLIQVNSFTEMEECLESLSDVAAVLLDQKSFDPPADFPLPLLMIGNGDPSGYPSLERPLHPESLSFAIDTLLSGGSQPSPDASDFQQPGFITSLLHEVLQDLNNQFTTLRGNIPLLLEQYTDDDGSLRDIHHATERGTQLLHLLEVLDPDTHPDPGIFSYETLRKDLLHFGNKMLPGLRFEEEIQMIQFVNLRGDPMLICNLFLQLLWIFRSHTSTLLITHHLKEKTLDLALSPEVQVKNPEGLKTRTEAFTSRRFPGRISIKAEGPQLIFSLQRE